MDLGSAVSAGGVALGVGEADASSPAAVAATWLVEVGAGEVCVSSGVGDGACAGVSVGTAGVSVARDSAGGVCVWVAWASWARAPAVGNKAAISKESRVMAQMRHPKELLGRAGA